MKRKMQRSIIPKHNRLVQPRLRGVSGPIAQTIGPGVVIHTPGNFIQPKS